MQRSSDRVPRGITRRRTGCLICRLRRKRCDEDKPVCQGCARNSLVCRWPSQQHGKSLSNNISWRKRLHAATKQIHSELGNPPRDQQHLRLGSPSSGSIKRGQACPFPQLLHGPSCKPMLLQTDVGSQFFQHFLELVALRLSSRNDSENPWIALFVPLAMEDELVMSALLALGGANLCTYAGNATKQTYSYYAVALRSAKHRVTELVQGNYSHLLNTLITTIALYQFEVTTCSCACLRVPLNFEFS